MRFVPTGRHSRFARPCGSIRSFRMSIIRSETLRPVSPLSFRSMSSFSEAILALRSLVFASSPAASASCLSNRTFSSFSFSTSF